MQATSSERVHLDGDHNPKDYIVFDEATYEARWVDRMARRIHAVALPFSRACQAKLVWCVGSVRMVCAHGLCADRSTGRDNTGSE